MTDGYLSKKELLKRLGIGKNTLDRWIEQGWFLQGTKFGPASNSKLYWPFSEVLAWEERAKFRNPPKPANNGESSANYNEPED